MLATITTDAQRWALDRWHVAQRNNPAKFSGYRSLAGFIGEAVVAEVLRGQGLRVDHGATFTHDLCVNDRYRVEIKTQTGVHRYHDEFLAWFPRHKPGHQDALVSNYMWIRSTDMESVMNADQMIVRGWISDLRTDTCRTLAKGTIAPGSRSTVLDSDVLEIPDRHLTPIETFHRSLDLL